MYANAEQCLGFRVLVGVHKYFGPYQVRGRHSQQLELYARKLGEFCLHLIFHLKITVKLTKYSLSLLIGEVSLSLYCVNKYILYIAAWRSHISQNSQTISYFFPLSHPTLYDSQGNNRVILRVLF